MVSALNMRPREFDGVCEGKYESSRRGHSVLRDFWITHILYVYIYIWACIYTYLDLWKDLEHGAPHFAHCTCSVPITDYGNDPNYRFSGH